MFDSPAGHIHLKEVEDLLQELPVEVSDATIHDNLSLVGRLGQPDSLVSIIEQVLSDKERLNEIASRSYRHVNLFDKIVLIDSDDELSYRLTLHLWNPPYSESELNEELIHDHRFSFWSTVLTGDLVSENFSRSQEGSVFRQYRYIPERVTDNFYEFVGEATLEKTQPSQRVAGESYYLSYERIHRVLLPQASTVCTMVLRGPRQRNHSNVFNTTYPQTDTRISNVVFSADEMEKKLSLLLETVVKRVDDRQA